MITKSLLDKGIFDEELVTLMREVYPEAPAHGVSFEPPGTKEIRQLQQFKDKLNGWFSGMEEGLRYFANNASPGCKEKILRFSEGNALEDVIELMLSEVFVFSLALGLTSQEMDSLYMMACDQLEEHLHHSRQLFLALIFLDYTQARFWVGLAYTYAKDHDDATADEVYRVAMQACKDNPIPYLYYVKYLTLHGDKRASHFLEEGLKRASKHPDLVPILSELTSLANQ